MSSMSVPVLVLVLIGVLLVALGLFVAGNFTITLVGVGAVVVAGVLQVLGQRRS